MNFHQPPKPPQEPSVRKSAPAPAASNSTARSSTLRRLCPKITDSPKPRKSFDPSRKSSFVRQSSWPAFIFLTLPVRLEKQDTMLARGNSQEMIQPQQRCSQCSRVWKCSTIFVHKSTPLAMRVSGGFKSKPILELVTENTFLIIVNIQRCRSVALPPESAYRFLSSLAPVC